MIKSVALSFTLSEIYQNASEGTLTYNRGLRNAMKELLTTDFMTEDKKISALDAIIDAIPAEARPRAALELITASQRSAVIGHMLDRAMGDLDGIEDTDERLEACEALRAVVPASDHERQKAYRLKSFMVIGTALEAAQIDMLLDMHNKNSKDHAVRDTAANLIIAYLRDADPATTIETGKKIYEKTEDNGELRNRAMNSALISLYDMPDAESCAAAIRIAAQTQGENDEVCRKASAIALSAAQKLDPEAQYQAGMDIALRAPRGSEFESTGLTLALMAVEAQPPEYQHHAAMAVDHRARAITERGGTEYSEGFRLAVMTVATSALATLPQEELGRAAARLYNRLPEHAMHAQREVTAASVLSAIAAEAPGERLEAALKICKMLERDSALANAVRESALAALDDTTHPRLYAAEQIYHASPYGTAVKKAAMAEMIKSIDMEDPALRFEQAVPFLRSSGHPELRAAMLEKAVRWAVSHTQEEKRFDSLSTLYQFTHKSPEVREAVEQRLGAMLDTMSGERLHNSAIKVLREQTLLSVTPFGAQLVAKAYDGVADMRPDMQLRAMYAVLQYAPSGSEIKDKATGFVEAYVDRIEPAVIDDFTAKMRALAAPAAMPA